MIAETLEELTVPIDAPKLFAGNARRGDVEKLKKSLEDHDQYRPIVLNKRVGTKYGDNTVLAGNHTLIAAREIGMTEIDVWYVDVDDDEALEINLVDNATSDSAYNDPALLAALLEQAKNTARAGYSDDFLDELLSGLPQEEVEGETDADAIPEIPSEPVSKLGDLWLLGNPRSGEHRLLCGDATIPEDVKRLMNGERATLMATDPPYLVNYDGSNHPGHAPDWSKDREKLWDAYKDQAASVDFYRAFLATAMENAIEEDAAIYQWHADLRRQLVIAAWDENGLLAHQTIIWAKNNPVLTRSHFMWQHEPALYGWKKGKQPKKHRRPPASASTVWPVDRDSRHNDLHPTAKPVELFKRPIGWHTRDGEVCYEPFGGSGSQLIAAYVLGRRCFAMEISPEYVDVICRRYQEFTGERPVLEATGEAHDFVSSSADGPMKTEPPHAR